MNKTQAFSWLVIFISIGIIFWGLSTSDEQSDSALISNEFTIPAVDNRALRPTEAELASSDDNSDDKMDQQITEVTDTQSESDLIPELIEQEETADQQFQPEIYEELANTQSEPEVEVIEEVLNTQNEPEIIEELADIQPEPEVIAELDDKQVESDYTTQTDSLIQESEQDQINTNEITAAPSALEVDIKNRVDEWRLAWQSGDANSYFRIYSSNFVPQDNAKLTDWQASRRDKINPTREIFIGLNNFELSLDETNTKSTIFFDQQYRSSNYSDVTRKQLDMVLEDNQWRIISEKTVN